MARQKINSRLVDQIALHQFSDEPIYTNANRAERYIAKKKGWKYSDNFDMALDHYILPAIAAQVEIPEEKGLHNLYILQAGDTYMSVEASQEECILSIVNDNALIEANLMIPAEDRLYEFREGKLSDFIGLMTDVTGALKQNKAAFVMKGLSAPQ